MVCGGRDGWRERREGGEGGGGGGDVRKKAGREVKESSEGFRSRF